MMIGVIASRAEVSVVCEFFELFKTPWEFYRDGSHYDVLVCDVDDQLEGTTAPLVITYTVSEPAGNVLSSGCERTERNVGKFSFLILPGSRNATGSFAALRFGILAASAV